MKNLRLLPLAALAMLCVSCDRPGTPPTATVNASAVAPAAQQTPQPEASPLPDMVVPAATHFNADPTPAPNLTPARPLVEISLPQGVTLDTQNSPENELALYEALKKPTGFRFVYGAGTRRMIILSDPGSLFDLGLFQMLEANADNLDATITILPYAPSDQPASTAKIQALYCSQSPERSWKAWMIAAQANTSTVFQTQGRIPETAWQGWPSRDLTPQACTPDQLARLAQIQSLGDQLQASFTPRTIFANGQSWPGPILDREDLEKIWWYVHGHQKIQG